MKYAMFTMAGVLLAAAAPADWNPGDGHNMHFPQTEDEFGWVLQASREVWDEWEFCSVADDWICTRSAPITAIHFWGGYDEGAWSSHQTEIIQFRLSVYTNNPDGPHGGPTLGDLLWYHDFFPGEWTVREIYPLTDHTSWHFPFGGGGWYYDRWTPIFQYNFEDIPDPFVPDEGVIYWLRIRALGGNGAVLWGVLESTQHWNAAALEFGFTQGIGWHWKHLTDPDTDGNIDLGLVLVSEVDCPGDLDGDGTTGQPDLGILLGDWGCEPPNDCVGDLDGDGSTGQADLGILLGDWGCGT